MKVISILNLKGGICKTTTTHNIASALRLKGYKVLLIDLDYQRSLTLLSGATNNITAYDVLTSDNPININDAINNDTIIASKDLLKVDNILNGKIGTQYRLKEALEPLKTIYDYCIIDNHNALNTLSINSLTASDLLIIPTTADYLALEGINDLYEFTKDIKKYTNPNLKIGGFLLVKYNDRAIINRDLKKSLEALSVVYGTKVYKSFIRLNGALREAQAMKQDIFTYDKKSNGAKDYLSFVNELIEEEKKDND